MHPTDSPQSEPPVRRLVRHLIVGLLLLILGGISVERAVQGSSDFRGFHRIWSANTHSPMQPVRVNTGPVKQDPDPYPPCSYVLFAPLGLLPVGIAAAIWYLLNLAASWGTWRGVEILAGRRFWKSADGWWLGIAVAPYWIGNLVTGQNAPLLMCLATWGTIHTLRGLPLVAALLFGIATLIKAIPAVLLLPSLIRFRWRVLIAWGLVLVLFIGGACTLYFGPNTNLTFHQRWIGMILHGPEGRPADPRIPDTLHSSPRFSNQSLEAVAARLLMAVPLKDSPPLRYVNVTEIDAQTWRFLTKGVTLLVVILSSITLWRRRRDSSDGLTELALASMTMLLMSPILWTHYCLWLFFPCAALLENPRTTGRVWSAPILLYACSAAHLGLGSVWLRGIGLHFWLILLAWGYMILKLSDHPQIQTETTKQLSSENS